VAIACDPTSLVSGAACLDCGIPPGMHRARFVDSANKARALLAQMEAACDLNHAGTNSPSFPADNSKGITPRAFKSPVA